MKKIYRAYRDTEIVQLATKVKCPYCGNEWLEEDKAECGETYIITCDEDEDGCGKQFKMYFDAD